MALKRLSIELRVGESVSVSGPATVQLVDKSGSRARLTVAVDESVRVERPRRVSSQDHARRGLGGKGDGA